MMAIWARSAPGSKLRGVLCMNEAAAGKYGPHPAPFLALEAKILALGGADKPRVQRRTPHPHVFLSLEGSCCGYFAFRRVAPA